MDLFSTNKKNLFANVVTWNQNCFNIIKLSLIKTKYIIDFFSNPLYNENKRKRLP